MEDFNCNGITHSGVTYYDDLLVVSPSPIGFNVTVSECGISGSMTIDDETAEELYEWLGKALGKEDI